MRRHEANFGIPAENRLGWVILIMGICLTITLIIGEAYFHAAGFAGVVLIALSMIWSHPSGTSKTIESPVKRESRSNNHKRVLIVGAGEAGRKIARELISHKEAPCHVVGFIDDDPEIGSYPGLSILGSRKEILEIVDQYAVDEVIISYAPSWQQRLAECLVSNGHRNLKVRLMPGLYETMIGKPKFDQIDDVPLIDFPQAETSPGYARIKRMLDAFMASFALVISLPIMILAAIAIKLTSPGPIFYSQERVGKDGKLFSILKLRTMIPNAEAHTGPTLSTGTRDTRVTRVGRLLRATRLDEIPQFINVLRGDMSMVGPRPERPCFVADYQVRIPSYRERLRVLPGITGLAQIHGFYQTPVYTKLRYDLMYIYNQSIFQDIKILLLTIKALTVSIGKQLLHPSESDQDSSD